jgi:hypothetical protein
LAMPALIALLWSKKNVHISFIVYTAYAYSIYIYIILYICSSIVKKWHASLYIYIMLYKYIFMH